MSRAASRDSIRCMVRLQANSSASAGVNGTKTQYSTDQPEVHKVIAEMRRVIDGFDSCVLIGEIYLPLHRLMAYYGNDLTGAQMPFNFALLSTFWSARSIETIIDDYEKALPKGAWPNWVLGNHDRPRVASRVGPEQARIARRDALYVISRARCFSSRMSRAPLPAAASSADQSVVNGHRRSAR